MTLIELENFRPVRRDVDQFMLLTTDIKEGFHRKHQISAAVIDPSATYDTMWREEIMVKVPRAK